MQTPFSSRLRFVDAGDIDDTIVSFDDLDVRGADGSSLGEVQGFIIDPELRRAYYLVVDSGGWFSSRHYLVPIGHARVGEDRRALQLDIDREAIAKYPDFDPDRFAKLTDEDLRRFQTRTLVACCPRETATSDAWGYERWAHYRQPAWWRPEMASLQRRSRPVARSSFSAPAAAAGQPRAEGSAVGTAGAGGDASPHLEGRAQPGDVLGIETSGETTSLGDTTEDENKRRESSDKRR
jgi:hypothetical protein